MFISCWGLRTFFSRPLADNSSLAREGRLTLADFFTTPAVSNLTRPKPLRLRKQTIPSFVLGGVQYLRGTAVVGRNRVDQLMHLALVFASELWKFSRLE